MKLKYKIYAGLWMASFILMLLLEWKFPSVSLYSRLNTMLGSFCVGVSVILCISQGMIEEWHRQEKLRAERFNIFFKRLSDIGVTVVPAPPPLELVINKPAKH